MEHEAAGSPRIRRGKFISLEVCRFGYNAVAKSLTHRRSLIHHKICKQADVSIARRTAISATSSGPIAYCDAPSPAPWVNPVDCFISIPTCTRLRQQKRIPPKPL